MTTQYDFLSESEIINNHIKDNSILRKAQKILDDNRCTLISQVDNKYNFSIEGKYKDFVVNVSYQNKNLRYECNCETPFKICSHISATLLFLRDYLEELREKNDSQGKKYSKEEMIERVLKERQKKANKEEYKLEINENLHGIHKLSSVSGRKYELTIRDFETEEGYCSCPDFRSNKLGTCKHLIYTISQLKNKYKKRNLENKHNYPFTEIYLDPKYNYNIKCFSPGSENPEVINLLNKYFPQRSEYIFPQKYKEFLHFLQAAQEIKEILIRPEVNEKIEKHFEKESLEKLITNTSLDYSKIKGNLFEYQKQGVEFSIFKSASIIADEMGLGKTIQAITTAVFKKEIFNIKQTLIICPASLKAQWKKEIEKFCDETAVIVEGNRDQRKEIYRNSDAFFLITNYEAVMRDITTIYHTPPDMIILDEAQRIKNYDTKTSHAVKAIPRKHALVITGTPLENRLLDLYSIMNFVDPHLLTPQWEFSMNHCYFDKSKKNKITGYYDLQKLHERLSDYIIRREKRDVLKQLPEVQEVMVPVELHPFQYDMLAGYVKSLSYYINKKHKTFFDIQRIQQILTSMRMTCDSSYLVDKETNYSPKLDELENILVEKLNIINSKKKIIIFSEWKTMLKLIGRMLDANKIGYSTLSGDVPVKKRGKLIDEFEKNPECNILLSTEAGGTGLNLQFADTVINFDLPWNPAKKNQRIGRVNRIGQKSSSITAINMVAINSIESRIADGIILKQELFNAVLNVDSITDEVDFSAKGRSTFIDQLKKMIELDLPEKDEFLQQEKEKIEEDIESPEIIESFESEDEIFNDSEKESENESKNKPKVQQTDKQAEDNVSESEQVEETLNNGLKFFSGLMKMATGKELLSEDQSISVDKKTGEVVMKFKLPIGK